MISDIDIKDFPNNWKPSEQPITLIQADIDSVITFEDNPLIPWLPVEHHKAVTTCINCFDEIYKSAFNSTLVTVWVKG
jgi:hypothetical protein